MGLFQRLGMSRRADAPATRDRDPDDDFWYESVSLPSKAGVMVTTRNARRVPVVRACLALLSETIAGLSFNVFERDENDDRNAIRNHPFAALLNNPNRRDTSFEFIANMVDDLASEGLFLAERRKLGTPNESLWRFPRSQYRVEGLPDGGRRFKIRVPGQPERTLLDDEVWFIAVPPYHDGVTGSSVIKDDGREAIGAAIALQDYASRFFENDATPPFVFKHKGQFDSETSKENFLSAWHRWFGGRNRGKPAVVEYGMEIQQLAATNEESQFLETRKELWLDIARLWRVPPHKVGILDKATFSNIEHQSLEFVTDTLGPWLELIERSAAKTFLSDVGHYFEFNVASLLRGDIGSRFAAYAVARQWGWLSVNEIRRLENRNGIGPAGDRFIEPLNMSPVGTGGGEGQSTQNAIRFLRQSVAAQGDRPKLEIVKNAA